MPDAMVAPARAHTSVPGPSRPAVGAPPYGAQVGHVAVALPETRVPNAVVAERLGVEPDWIVSRTGIHERRIAAPEQTLAGLAAEAGSATLAAAGVKPDAVDLILVATTSADQLLPAAAPVVAHLMGATHAGAMDVGAACTGFLSGLALGAGTIESGRAETVVVIGAEILTRMTDPDDRRTAAVFGDGAGAALLSRSDGPGRIGPVTLGSDGAGAPLLFADKERGVIEMDGAAVYRHAVARMGEATLAACARADLELEDIDLFVFHQANARILKALGDRLGLDPTRVVDCIGPHGNTSAASIPIALDAAQRDGRLFDGARVLVSAFGAGFTWGAGVVEW